VINVRRSVALGAIVALLLAACGDENGPTADESTAPSASSGTQATDSTTAGSTTAPPTTEAATTTTVDLAAALDGRTFVSTAVEGYELVDGTQVELTFDGANVGAVAGCNQMGSTWSLEGDVLVVPEPAMTAMACEPAALMDQDTWLAAVLTSRPTVALDGDTLTLSADRTFVTLVDRETADPDRPLEGTTWNLDSIVAGDAVSSLPAGAGTPTLRFDGGELTVDTGCNTGSGRYTVAGADITIEPIALTRRACLDEASGAVEQAMLTVLTGTVGFEIDADVLTLTNGANGLVLQAAPEGGTTPEGLERVPWLLDSIVTGSTTTPVPPGVRRPTLRLTAGTVTVDTGCNSGSGTYTLAGDQITFGPLTMTLIACEGVTNDVEQAQLAVLTGTATATVTDGVLTLTNGDRGLHYLAG
jgi:heat shock protein HslJ